MQKREKKRRATIDIGTTRATEIGTTTREGTQESKRHRKAARRAHRHKAQQQKHSSRTGPQQQDSRAGGHRKGSFLGIASKFNPIYTIFIR